MHAVFVMTCDQISSAGAYEKHIKGRFPLTQYFANFGDHFALKCMLSSRRTSLDMTAETQFKRK